MSSDLEILVEPSPDRCYTDEEYKAQGVTLSNDLSSCDVLLGVKEPKLDYLYPYKTYFVFSHTIKAQPYNRDLLLGIMDKKIRLIDYEVLTNNEGQRLIAFGRFAGLVGAHNALWTYVKRHGGELPRLSDLKQYADIFPYYQSMKWPTMRIVLTGDGRVASGAAETLDHAGITRISIQEFLQEDLDFPTYCQLSVADYLEPLDSSQPFNLHQYFTNPSPYHSTFERFYKKANVMINGIYWDTRSPAFFTPDEMKRIDFKLEVIADITCDIAPEASIPSTLRASTIADPVYGYNANDQSESFAFSKNAIDVMAVDNLPNEIPRDASESFGQQFVEHILPELLAKQSDILDRGTITNEGALGKHFQYLKDYVNGNVV